MEESLRSVKGTVRGRVQGVFYRASLRDRARAEGLSGWVRNTSDGRVEFRLQGDPEAVEDVIAWARSGPPHARVEDVSVSEVDWDGALATFEVVS